MTMKVDLNLRDLEAHEAQAILSYATGVMGNPPVEMTYETKPAPAAKKEKPVKEEKPKKTKKAEVVEQAALDEAEEMFDGESDELGLDEPAEPEFTADDALNALKKYVSKLVKKGMTDDNAKVEAKKLLAAFQVKAVKDLTSDQIAALIKKVG